MGVETVRVDGRAVAVALEKRVQTWRWLAIAQIVAGLLATFGIPAVLAALCMAGTDGHHPWRVQPSSIGGWTWYGLWLVLLMPAGYLLEWRTQGGFLMRKLMEIENSDGGWYEAVTRDRTWRWDARAGAAQWEIVLFAPRMVFGGFAKLRGMRMVSVANAPRAAEVLEALVAREHGVETERLRRTGEERLTFGRVMSYLIFYEWVGVSEDGKKVWALSESREELLG